MERLLRETNSPDWRHAFRTTLDTLEDFENLFGQRRYIELIRLADPEEILSGKVYIAFPFKAYDGLIPYTLKTYILHFYPAPPKCP